MIDITLPGTGGMQPLPGRWLTCCFIELAGRALLIDCGEGTQIALQQAGCKLSRIDAICITHYHADHVAGLPGLLLTLGNCAKTTPLHIAGPKGLRTVLQGLLVLCPHLPYEIYFSELPADKPSQLSLCGFEVTAAPLQHAVECLGYAVEYRRKPVFNPQKAEALGVPREHWRTLHAGMSIRHEGREVTPEMVTDGARAPYKIAYCTDTRPTGGIVSLAKGADLFICEGMYGDDAESENAVSKRHMLFSEAASLARQAGAKELWLTHFSPAMPAPALFAENARRVFANSVVACDGQRKSL